MKKITVLVLLATLFVLAGCNDNSYGYNDRNYNNRNNADRYDYYYNDYMDDYELLISDIDHLSISNLDDLAEMVAIAWEYDAIVEVEYHFYDGGYEVEEIFNEQQLEDFLGEFYRYEIEIDDVQVLEDDNYNLVLLFIVDVLD